MTLEWSIPVDAPDTVRKMRTRAACAEVLPSSEEQGFVLIAVLWMLVLLGSVAALLMMRASTDSEIVSSETQLLRKSLAMDGATETVLGDRRLNGPRSRWWLLPAQHDVQLGDQIVSVKVSNESGRVDLNDADLRAVDDLLRLQGASSSERSRFAQTVVGLRGSHRHIGSFEQVDAIGREAGIERISLRDRVTLVSGLLLPKTDEPAVASPGDALRIEERSKDGARRTTIARETADLARPVLMTDAF